MWHKVRFGVLVGMLLAGGLWATSHHHKHAHKKQQQEEKQLEGPQPLVSDTEIGLRTIPLEDEKDLKLHSYDFHKKPPGESQRFERAYENAPPMIPHDTTGLLPITKESNQCLGCHAPDVASSVGATPVPKSHLFDFRNNHPTKDGNVSDARFNCTQCHAPQANAQPLVKNNFKPVFTNKTLEFRSDFMDVVDVGVKGANTKGSSKP
ncbi:nitrate reductase cytochrome c-type subunit [Helicobacter baculiformis]|uniref:Periplasmic nitrate reductase, electron transfer subunit n=1 Tax=Helicobacter baculiformis TaxID=427351 RepID=A0ABV7ZL04_9HELI|nr:nitrate reductase cytochrome c-type subunit [Helicobacter baculiformis]